MEKKMFPCESTYSSKIPIDRNASREFNTTK